VAKRGRQHTCGAAVVYRCTVSKQSGNKKQVQRRGGSGGQVHYEQTVWEPAGPTSSFIFIFLPDIALILPSPAEEEEEEEELSESEPRDCFDFLDFFLDAFLLSFLDFLLFFLAALLSFFSFFRRLRARFSSVSATQGPTRYPHSS